MLREALRDPDNEKFIFVSETTLPIADFDTVYRQVVAEHPHSMFIHHPNPHAQPGKAWDGTRNLAPIPLEMQVKHTQWVVLNRKHAQAVVDDTAILEITTKYIHDDEHHIGTLLALRGELAEVIPRDVTYVCWEIPDRKGRYPFEFTDLNDLFQRSLFNDAQQGRYLFARKFHASCELLPLDVVLSYRRRRKSLADIDASYRQVLPQIEAMANAGNYMTAISFLEAYVAQYPDFAEGHNDLAVLLHAVGRGTEALEHVQRAAVLDPGSERIAANLAALRLALGA